MRLGVRKIDLIDPDFLSDSNVTRVYGSRLADAGKPKVEVLAGHLAAVMPTVEISAVQSMITSEGTARLLLDADSLLRLHR